MKCIKCGNELSENAQFCTNCGASQEQKTQPVNSLYEQAGPNTQPVYPTYAQSVPDTYTPNRSATVSVPLKSKKDVSFIMRLVINAMGVFSGIVSIIMGVIISCKYCGNYAYSNSYGGDAYTGIQNAAADTANNVLASNRIITDGLCFICVSIGLAVIFYFASKLLDTILAKKALKNEENK